MTSLLPVLLALAVACKGDPPAPAPPTAQAPPAAATPAAATPAAATPEVPPPATPAAPMADGAAIVTDISASMAGFLEKGSVRLSRLHEALVGAVGGQYAGALDTCLVGDTLTCGQPVNTARYSGALYTAGSSRFDTALDPAPEAPNGLASRRLTLLVTDGVYGGLPATTSSPENACANGASVACISNHLRRAVEQGYGVWALGVALPFKGTVFTECAMGPAEFAQVQAALPPEQVVSDFKPSPAKASYRYTGPRPLLVLVLSRDHVLGRAVAADVATRLTSMGIADATLGVVSSEWAPLQPSRSRIADVSVEPNGRSEDFRPLPGAREGDVFVQAAQCGRGDKALFRVRVTGDAAALALTPGDGFDPQVVRKLEPAPDGFTVGILCDPLAPGDRKAYPLALAPKDRVASLQAPWWTAWSASDAFTTPSRLFGLSTLARTTVETAATTLGPDDRVVFRIERK